MVTEINLSAFEYILPLLSFLLVFVVVFIVIVKSKLTESKFVQLLVAFIVALLFVSVSGASKYILTITPWFAVFVVSLAFILAMAGFFGKIPEGLTKGIGIVFVIGLLIVFLISAYFVFSPAPFFTAVKGWILSPRIYGALILLVVGAVAAWILSQK